MDKNRTSIKGNGHYVLIPPRNDDPQHGECGRTRFQGALTQALGRDPYAGDLYVFRGRRGDLVKIVWHDGIGMSLYMKRLERGRFISYGLCQLLSPHVVDRLVSRRCFS